MRRRLMLGLLVLSLLTTWVDDLVAAAAPESSDAIQATENNDYLASAKPYRQETPTQGLTSPTHLSAPQRAVLSLADLRHSSRIVAHFATDGTDLLYRLSCLLQ
jgi:hypothetical protein